MNLRKELFEKIRGLERFVLVTVIEISGSAPREIGARMVVTEESETGSIGGGNLEYQAIQSARDLLAHTREFKRRTEFSGLGVTLKQCCGGAVQLMFEAFAGESAQQLVDTLAVAPSDRPRFLVTCVSDDEPAIVVSRRSERNQLPDLVWDAAQTLVAERGETSCMVIDGETQWFITHLNEPPTKIVLFGAGHVGKALVKLLQDLPFQIDWVDSRADIFPAFIPANTRALSPDDLFRFINEQPADVCFVVMTHDHGLDYELCSHILRHRQFSWLGLIGSKTKRLRFEQRLFNEGVDSFTLKRLVCPIGIPAIRGKFPAAIALSTATQLLELHNYRINRPADKSVMQVEARS